MSISRRDLLRTAGVTFGVTGFGLLVGACGAGQAAAPVLNAGRAAPRQGGVLRAVFTGGGAAESLDPYGAGSPVDYVRNDVLFDSLFTLRGGTVVPALGLSAVPAVDGRSFVLKLRPKVRWHDGSPFTAADVAYSFRYMSAPARAYPSQLSAYFDVAGIKVQDDLTLLVPAKQPVGDPALFLAAFPAKMVKNNATSFTAKTAIGTGAYRVTAFEAGREARLRRFDQHWSSAPRADELILVSLTDPQAKVNAMSTGQADYAGDIPFTTAKTGVSGADLEIRSEGAKNRTAFGFVLNTTRPPFNDPRVRKAVRLAIDRQALVNTVLLGFGAPGNDLLGDGAKYFNARKPLSRDVNEAKKLLKAAGASGARITIRSAEWEIGYNSSTQLFVEQLRQIGLDARAQIVSPPEFFDAAAVSEANGVAFSSGAVPLAVTYGRLSGMPPLAFPDPEFTAALTKAIGSTNEQQRGQAWTSLQNVMYDRGNTIVWGQADVLSLAKKKVTGIAIRDQAKYPYLGNAGLG